MGVFPHGNKLHERNINVLILPQKVVLEVESVPASPDPPPVALLSQVIRINLNSIVATVSGPKRPQDRVAVTEMKRDFRTCLSEKVGRRPLGRP